MILTVVMQPEYAEIRKKCWAKKDEIQEFYADKVQFEAISAVLKPDRPVFALRLKIKLFVRNTMIYMCKYLILKRYMIFWWKI